MLDDWLRRLPFVLRGAVLSGLLLACAAVVAGVGVVTGRVSPGSLHELWVPVVGIVVVGYLGACLLPRGRSGRR